MANPYQATETGSGSAVARRGVRRYFVAALVMIALAVCVSLPGAVLLNQKWEVIPVDVFLTDLESNGRSVPLETAMHYSLVSGAMAAVVAFSLAVCAWRNLRRNREAWLVEASDSRR